MIALGHDKFILTPISSILAETVTACNGIGFGMESFPLRSPILQATTLRMTGALEQKLKCICWEIASFDYTFRYNHILREPLGECSSYDDKKKIFKGICLCLKKYGIDYEFDDTSKDMIIDKSMKSFETMIKDSAFERWFEREYKDYLINRLPITRTSFINHSKDGTPEFLNKALKEYYGEIAYRQRNRYAHNLMSYQQNIPTLSEISSPEYEHVNHFKIFSILILIDEIFMILFSRFFELKKNHSYEGHF